MTPRTIADIQTPALVLDIAAMERNIKRMADFFVEGPCKLRPHFKAHKTPEIAKRQLAAGSVTGLTCATVGEAEVAAEFCEDILIANQVIGSDKLARVAAIAKRGIDMKIAVDSVEGLDQAAAAAGVAGAEIGLLVDVNVGMPRCGVAPGEAAAALARRISDTAGVRLRGAMGSVATPSASPTGRSAKMRPVLRWRDLSPALRRSATLACPARSSRRVGLARTTSPAASMGSRRSRPVPTC